MGKSVEILKKDNDDDYESSDESEGEEEEEEFCPPGCDPALYEKVCELREKRLDQEEILNEFHKSVEILKKDNKQQKLETVLNSTQNKLVAEYTPSQQDKELDERRKLVNLIKLQAKEMEALK